MRRLICSGKAIVVVWSSGPSAQWRLIDWHTRAVWGGTGLPSTTQPHDLPGVLRLLPRLLWNAAARRWELSREEALKLWAEKRQQGWQPCAPQ